MMDIVDMLVAVKDKSVVKFDVCDIDEWIGESFLFYGKDFCLCKGCILEVKWIEWYWMMKLILIGLMFKNKEEVFVECVIVGIILEMLVVFYCFKGVWVFNIYFVFKEVGVKDVKIYFGFWNEWFCDFVFLIEEGLLY